ncbi:TRAP-type C4-dicarboxylate transport system permease small subunit [Scopulibacillus daqui]|uniref:TRAP-type C4-dicarboxylate transport system permease small subunit n=1 Tax=Scopulibacillus daqui TaxID=1469162 RepID=A0ABS2Q1K4_9BACL|nr:DUF2627 domain-containing protein [Scopulibacillus daqui]MBM7646106.1 TRAP-type C4-dicarboxylate transport system permease small subunit [Scopulibacillus daqui]
MSRFIALLLIVVPGAIAAVGIKLMRDTLFDFLNPPFPWIWLQFVCGFVFALAGVSFIGGWIYYRDKKRNYSYREKRRNKINNGISKRQ